MKALEALSREHAQASGFGRFQAHRFNYAYPGEQPERIWQRIRGGSNIEIVKGADVMGHGHVHPDFKDKISIGSEFDTETEDGRQVTIRLESVGGIFPWDSLGMVEQKGEDELGFLFTGKVLAIKEPVKKSRRLNKGA